MILFLQVRKGNKNMNIRYEEVDCSCQDFICLSNQLDHYLNQAIGGEEKREKYKGFNRLETMDYVLIAYMEHIPVGCAALRRFSENEIEVKRVFVLKDYRNYGIATNLMRQLADYAVEKGYDKMILETGEFLEASVRLYTDFGFYKISNYGVYAGMKESLCMELNLKEIRYSFQREFRVEEIRDLFQSVNWLSADYAARLVEAFQNAGTVVTAWQGKTLIGLAEVVDDGELVAYIHYLLVRPEYQKRRIGKSLLDMVKKRYKKFLYLVVISEEEKNAGFYKKSGFDMKDTAVPLMILKT